MAISQRLNTEIYFIGANMFAYSTTIQTTVRLEEHTAEKSLCEFVESKGISWTVMPGLVTFNIEKDPFASGKTKNAFVVRFWI